MASATRVAVSGITGFIGAQVAADLLTKGYTVHGTCRKNTPERIAHLTSLEDVTGKLVVFEADLNTSGSFDSAVENCDYAIHIASPYAQDVADPQRDLVDPAVNGTVSFLASCKKAAVKKVVLTSSVAAIADGGDGGKVVDESVWNTRSSLKSLPYFYSKSVAEKAAWNYVETEAPDIKLVVINPTIVLGPSLVKAVNESATILLSTVKGVYGGIFDLDLPIVDVRDVSEAHIRAMESDTASGRYICGAVERLLPHREVVDIANGMGFNVPTRDLSGGITSKIIKLVSYFSPGGDAGQYVRNHLGNPIVPTNAKIKADLDMTFRDPGESVKDTFKNLLEWGHVENPST